MHMMKNHDELPEGWWHYPNTLSGYRVNLSWKSCLLSIFDTRHNEFWMIWSDLLPMFVYGQIFVWYVTSDKFRRLDEMHQVMTGAIYFAVFITRVFSSIYHIFNCMSLRLNQILINLDLMGICQGSLGSSWFMATYLGIRKWQDDRFLVYVSILYTNYIMCMVVFSYLLMSADKSAVFNRLAINLLLVLAVIGNAPLIAIGCSNSFPMYLRICCLCGTGTLSLGYMIYSNNIPEVFMKVGIADGKIWNSHVIWHNLVTIAQACFICATMV